MQFSFEHYTRHKRRTNSNRYEAGGYAIVKIPENSFGYCNVKIQYPFWIGSLQLIDDHIKKNIWIPAAPLPTDPSWGYSDPFDSDALKEAKEHYLRAAERLMEIAASEYEKLVKNSNLIINLQAEN